MKKYIRYKDKTEIERKLANFRRCEQKQDQRQTALKDNYRASAYYAGEVARLRWHSNPARHCPGWVQQLQGLPAEKLVSAINAIIAGKADA